LALVDIDHFGHFAEQQDERPPRGDDADGQVMAVQDQYACTENASWFLSTHHESPGNGAEPAGQRILWEWQREPRVTSHPSFH